MSRLVRNLLVCETATNKAAVAKNDLTIVGPRPEYNLLKPITKKKREKIMKINQL